MRVSFIATRIAGTDGVSLEAERWRDILTKMGHKVTFIAGQLDRKGILIPELHFQTPNVVKIYDKVVYSKNSFSKVEAEVFAVAGKIEGLLREVMNNGGKPDLLIIPNVLSLPMNFPLAVAVSRLIEEFKIPTIARHHDFWWERQRFLRSSLFPFFKRWFPPDLPQIKHVTINSLAHDEFKKRTGLPSEIIWDSFDFDSKENLQDAYSKHFREDFKLKANDIIFLQATRIVPRKRIELSIKLVNKLNNPRVVLIIAGYSGDEGRNYEAKLRRLAKKSGIRYRFISHYVNSHRRVVRKYIKGKETKRRIYTLWDSFKNADFVVYPTKKEGFGNQFVETIYFKKPLILTPYPVYTRDIKPMGFSVVEMDESIGKGTLKDINELLKLPLKAQEIVEKNFKIGEKYLSYKWAEVKISKLISGMKP